MMQECFDNDPISLVSDTIWCPVVKYQYVVFPMNLDKIALLAFNWQILKFTNLNLH